MSLKAYAITEDAQHRDLDGPSTTIPLSEMISSVLPPEKKDKLTELNNVRIVRQLIYHFRNKSYSIIHAIYFVFFRHYKMVAVRAVNQLVLQA